MNKKKSSMLSIIACLIAMVCVGVIYLWSALKTDAMSYYGWTKSAANLVASFMMFAFCVGNLIGGALNDRIGPKKVSILGVALFGIGVFLSSLLPKGGGVALFYLTYSVMGGIGVGVAYGAILSCIQKWFPHKRGFASGLACCFFGLGTVVFSPVIKGMINAFDIAVALRILGAIFLIVGELACLLIRLPDEEYLAALPVPAPKKSGIVAVKDYTLGETVKTLPFWCMLLSIFFYNGTWNMLNPLIKDLGADRGLSEAVAITCLSLTGAFNAGGRLIMATVSDKIGRTTTVIILSVVTIVCGILLTFAGGYAYLAVVLITAFAFGGPSAINPATSTDIFGAKYSGTNYGVIMLGLGISSIVFNAISNALYEATGKYTMTFIMGAITAGITIVLMIMINVSLKRMQAPTEKENTE